MEARLSCLKYVEGEVLCLRSASLSKEDDGPRSSRSPRPVEALPFGTEVVLERYFTAPGEELATLQQLTAPNESGVLATSLNYVGTTTASPSIKTAGSRAPASKAPKWHFLDTGGHEASVAAGELPALLASGGIEAIVAVVDPAPDHCLEVMRAVAAGLNHRSLAVLGAHLPRDEGNFHDLYTISALLLSTLTLPFEILAINLSADYGQVCLGEGKPGGAQSPPDEISTAAYSFPFFESVLEIVLRDVNGPTRSFTTEPFKDGSRTIPAVFAAAGNRATRGGVRWRLGYPAVRPETIAVTYVTKTAPNSYALSDCADAPAAYDLKPCLALDVQGLDAAVPVTGTSFACAWLAGHYARLALLDSSFAAECSRPIVHLVNSHDFCESRNRKRLPRRHRLG
jgi:hypothetical protein